MKIQILPFVMLLAVGCASKHVGYEGSSISGYRDMKITAERIEELSDETNHFYSLTVENTGSEWLRIDEADLEFTNSEMASHRLIVGHDLKAWLLSNEERQALEAQNHRMVLEGIEWASLGALAIGVVSRDKNLMIAGVGGVAGTGIYKRTDEILKDKRKTETAKMVPESHIYSGFTVPSSGFTRKWFLVHAPKNSLSETALLTVKTVEGKESVYRLQLKKQKSGQSI
ncbi:MAG: hypothetical protein ACAH59_06370 [Pseudobdellovibrionaceae bacterium]